MSLFNLFLVPPSANPLQFTALCRHMQQSMCQHVVLSIVLLTQVSSRLSFLKGSRGSLESSTPHTNIYLSHILSDVPTAGYAFLLFREEVSVHRLVKSCLSEEGKLYIFVSSLTQTNKKVGRFLVHHHLMSSRRVYYFEYQCIYISCVLGNYIKSC